MSSADSRAGGGLEPHGPTGRYAPDEATENFMGRYLLLWLLGIPIPVLFLIWAFGGLS